MELIKELSGMLMALCFMSCNVPQIYKILKTKSAKDLSVYYILTCLSAYVFGITYLCLSEFVFWILLNYLTGMLTTGILLVCYLKYRN